MFTSGAKNRLKLETTDYEIDQVANAIECMSDEQYSKEKLMLWDQVKHAKYLSQSRNLLQNGDFEDVFHGWTTSDHMYIQSDNSTFKGNYLNISGARDIYLTIFPTYIYQKIDESKLKPYTRYLVRGFVGSSKDVELVVSRYGKEIDTVMNVPFDIPYVSSRPVCNELYDGEQQPYPNGNVGYYNPMSAFTPSYTSDARQCMPGKKQIVCQDSHQFKFHIDTGEVDYNTNIGIWVMFKISSPDGYALLDNLEVIEEGPIDGEALSRVKHMEKKWNDQMEAKRSETQQAYDVA
ncbi:pesticidial crystal protein, partial [Bacillus thuringiensis]|nr:pesticidial crystal protein [Bacillus thuringiensis]